MRKAFKHRLYPNEQQQRLLERQVEECRWRYNHLLAERRDAWEQREESVRLYDQHATLPALKAERPSLAGVQSQVLQNVAVRIDLAFQRQGPRPSPLSGPWALRQFHVSPSARRLSVEDTHPRVMNVGQVKTLVHRPLEGTPKTATLRRSGAGKW